MCVQPIEQDFLEMAIQTVLYSYKNKLQEAAEEDESQLVRKMAEEIYRKAEMFQTVTQATLKELEAEF